MFFLIGNFPRNRIIEPDTDADIDPLLSGEDIPVHVPQHGLVLYGRRNLLGPCRGNRKHPPEKQAGQERKEKAKHPRIHITTL